MALSLAQEMRTARTEAEVKDIFKTQCNVSSVGIDAIDLRLPHIYFEAKYTPTDIYRMLAQLVLTIHRDAAKIDFPEYIGGFDSVKCGIIEFDELYQALEMASDMNWTQVPSSVDAKTVDLVRNLAAGHVTLYNYADDEKQLKSAIRQIMDGRGLRGQSLQKKITINNFVSVFMKWQKELGNNIKDVADEYAKDAGITLGDFYLADLLSENNEYIPELENLKVLRSANGYKSNTKIGNTMFTKEYAIINPDKHSQFWNKYKRPPKKEYWEIIQKRRYKLVPQHIREITGAYFTPQIWVEKSQEYMGVAFGNNFADMYIWDCAAGTGNLLVGLPQERRNIFASTLQEPDVQIMHQNTNLFKNNVFQFDFLNDEFKPVRDGGKLPDRLYDIIKDPEKQKKLLIYINPPYSETDNRKSDRSGVATNNKVYAKYSNILSKASNEIYAQFLVRIYVQIPLAKLGLFATLKMVSAPNFTLFRDFFRARYLGGFVVHAATFDNIDSRFPIAFTMWDLATKQPFVNIVCNVIDNNGKTSGRKKFFAHNPGVKFVNDWIRKFKSRGNSIGIVNFTGNDVQQHNLVAVRPVGKPMGHNSKLDVTGSNLIEASIYFAVRHAIPATWLNDRDQFMYPTTRIVDGAENLLDAKQEFLYETDEDFKTNCLIFTLFHNQNRISSNDGINHWIPFSEEQVGCKSAFTSDFMFKFLTGRGVPDSLSPAARAVYDSGLAIWRYYHARGENPDASFYDIKDFFKGRKEDGKIKNKSDNPEFNALASKLTDDMHALATKIEDKIYEYGFLKK